VAGEKDSTKNYLKELKFKLN